MNDLITVIIPTCNRVNFLIRAIQSVRFQTYINWEMVIVDDVSVDATPWVCADFVTRDKRIKFVRNERSVGGAQSRNIGIAQAKGKWVAFLDDDDFWAPKKLDIQIRFLRKYPKLVACTCSFLLVSDKGYKRIITPSQNPGLTELLFKNSLGGASMCFCAAENLKAIGGFDGALRSGQDWDLWLRFRLTGQIGCCPETLVYYTAHNNKRISRDDKARYAGLRRLYFKQVKFMGQRVRQVRLLQLYFLRVPVKRNYFSVRLADIWVSLMGTSVLVILKKSVMFLPRIIQAVFISRSYMVMENNDLIGFVAKYSKMDRS